MTITRIAYVTLTAAILLAFWFLYLGGYFSGDISTPDPARAKEIQPFITGLVLPLLTLGSTLLVIANLRSNTVQNISNNFFKLIDQHHKLVDNINTEIEGFDKPSEGREFFDDLASRIANDYYFLNDPFNLAINEGIPLASSLGSNEPPKYEIDSNLILNASGKKGKDLLIVIYDHFFHLHQSDLGHYFRNLYHIVRFIERSTIRQKSKIEFIKMLRAQLSNYEILFLAYNGIHEYGAKFYPLIEKYELLKNLNNEIRVPENYERRIVDIDVLTSSYSHLAKYWKENQSQKEINSIINTEKLKRFHIHMP